MEYDSGRQRVVRHLGSAHTEAELGLLLEQARDLLADPAQASLVLDVEASPSIAALVAEPGEPGLFPLPGRTAGVGADAGGSAGSRPGRDSPRDSPGRVLGTASRVLYDALGGVYDGLGFDPRWTIRCSATW